MLINVGSNVYTCEFERLWLLVCSWQPSEPAHGG